MNTMPTSPVLTFDEMAEVVEMYGFAPYRSTPAVVKRRMIDITRASDTELDSMVSAVAALPWVNPGSIGTASDGRYVLEQSADCNQLYIFDRVLVKVGAARWVSA